MSGTSSDEVRLTGEQRLPLAARGVSVALAAGAGCGKTTVLTERFLGEIDGLEGRPLRALAAMTFTDKAARELRQRIRARCRSKLRAGADPSWWTSVLRALEAAPIGTFHEFCGRLLRGYARGLSFDPEFAILDPTIAGSLREQAVGSAIRRLLSRRDFDLLQLAVVHGLKPIRELLESALAARTPDEIDPICALSPEELTARWRAVWEARGRPAVLTRLGPAARRCLGLLENLEATSPKLLTLRADVLDAMAAVDSPGCTDDDLERLRESARIAGLRGKDWPDEEVKERIKEAFTALRGAIKDVRDKSTWDEATTLGSAEDAIRFARLVREVRADYDELKVRQRGLDFGDLIVRTRDALRDLGDAVDAAPGGVDPSAIEFVLIDEFQDTDRLQSDILRLLGRSNFLHGRLFVVGDAKQSIYRFRGAEPAIFGRWREEFLENGRLRLSENFRTVPRVLHFVNALFADTFGAESRLAPVRPDQGTEPSVSFFWVAPPAADDEDEPSSKPSASEGRVREAEALARWLRARIDSGWTVVDRATREPRRAHPGDVALLLRAMTDVWPYETALADEGFEYHTVGGSAFYSQQEILDVVNVLSVVEDPLDEVALAGCLRSPFFAISDEGLYWLSRSAPGAGLSRGLESASRSPGLSDRDRKQAERARALLSRWRAMKDHVPMAELLSRIIDDSGFAAALVCEFLGPRKLANVRKLVRTAREFDRRGGFGLADYVGRLRAFADDPPREEQAAVTEEDSPSIRIMTVHQAKGLEFPIVILPDLNKSVGRARSALGFDADLGLVLRPRTDASKEPDDEGGEGCLGWRTYQAIEDREEREESLRLFYVAATRARDHLVLSAGLGAPLEAVSPAKLSPALNLVWERFDGRTGRFLAALPEGWPAPEVEVVDVAAIEPSGAHRAKHHRVDLLEIVDAVNSTPCDCEPPSRRVAPPPRFLDLDEVRDDGSRASRVGGLIREAAVDAGTLAGEPPAAIAARLGRRMIPSAVGGQVDEAVSWLTAWVESRFFERLKAAPAVRLLRARTWTLHGASHVVRGSCDAVVQGEDGGWRPLVFLARGESEAWGRLRASLSIPALARDGFRTVGPAWLIRTSADGTLRVERCDPLAGSAFDDLVREWRDSESSAMRWDAD